MSDPVYTPIKNPDGTVNLTATTSVTPPPSVVRQMSYQSLAELQTWLSEVKNQQVANAASRTAAALADQAEVDRRQAVVTWAMAQGVK